MIFFSPTRTSRTISALGSHLVIFGDPAIVQGNGTSHVAVYSAYDANHLILVQRFERMRITEVAIGFSMHEPAFQIKDFQMIGAVEG